MNRSQIKQKHRREVISWHRGLQFVLGVTNELLIINKPVTVERKWHRQNTTFAKWIVCGTLPVNSARFCCRKQLVLKLLSVEALL
jgi:hypothetical protein